MVLLLLASSFLGLAVSFSFFFLPSLVPPFLLKYPDICYFRFLSLSFNFASCSSFLGFLSWSCIVDLVSVARLRIILSSASILILLSSIPLHSLNEKRLPFSLFSCLFWYLLSRRIVFALFGIGISSVHFLFFSYFMLFFLLKHLSWYLLSRIFLWTLPFAMYMSFRIILLRSVFILIPPRRPCSSLPLRKGHFSPLFPIIPADIYYIPASFSLFRASSFTPLRFFAILLPFPFLVIIPFSLIIILSSVSCLISHTFPSNIRVPDDRFDHANGWTRYCFNDLYVLIVVLLSLQSLLPFRYTHIRATSSSSFATSYHNPVENSATQVPRALSRELLSRRNRRDFCNNLM